VAVTFNGGANWEGGGAAGGAAPAFFYHAPLVVAWAGPHLGHDGTLVEANHFGPTATVASLTLDSGLTFGALGSSQTRFSVTGNPTLAYSTSTATASTVTDSAYKALLQNQVNSVSSNASCALTLPGLTIGRTYRIQLISDGFPGDLSVEGGSAVNYYFSGDCVSAATWTAADTIGNVNFLMGYGATTLSLKGYALHDITTLATRAAATATAAISNGTVTGYTMTSAGSGYTSVPAVTMSGGVFVTPVQATATSTVSNGVVTGFTVTNAGAGYPTVSNAGSSYVTTPAVTVAAPSAAVTATATATVIALAAGDDGNASETRCRRRVDVSVADPRIKGEAVTESKQRVGTEERNDRRDEPDNQVVHSSSSAIDPSTSRIASREIVPSRKIRAGFPSRVGVASTMVDPTRDPDDVPASK
jgi:hypothetical protein